MYDIKYEVKKTSYTIGEICEYITSDESYVILDGISIKVEGLRLKTLCKEHTCNNCLREGTHFKLCNNNFKNPQWHLCLWSDDHIQMTKDHIIPSSKGGANYIDNMQCLCTICNGSKKDDLTDNDLKKGALREDYDDFIKNKDFMKKNNVESKKNKFKRDMYYSDLKHAIADKYFNSFHELKLISEKIEKYNKYHCVNVFILNEDQEEYIFALQDGILDLMDNIIYFYSKFLHECDELPAISHSSLKLVPKKIRRLLINKEEERR